MGRIELEVYKPRYIPNGNAAGDDGAAAGRARRARNGG